MTVDTAAAPRVRGSACCEPNVLRSGGRFAVSDVTADEGMEWPRGDLEIVRSHRVHAHAGSAIVRARKR